MALCNGCQSIKLAEALKGTRKLDKRDFTKLSRQLSSGYSEYILEAGKSILALFEWKMWSMYGSMPVIRSGEFHNVFILANLGLRSRQLSSKNCAFCTLLSSILTQSYDDASESKAHVLIAPGYLESPNYQRRDDEATPSDVIVLGVISETDKKTVRSMSDFEELMRAKSRGFLTCRLNQRESKESRFIRALQRTIDCDEVSRLIRNCQQNHHECREEKTASPQPIKINLIDCHNRKLIQTTSSDQYVALSYVWGGVSAGTLESTKLPRTLEDAIQVTRSLGFRYLWVDQFCVDQQNHDIKQEQIRTMGRVYEDAVVTLVAASGSNANHGLPGAPGHPNPRKAHPPVTVDGCIVTEEAVPIGLEIRSSPWANRGWTFQEQFFSRRFLIFSPSQISFECRYNSFSPRFGFRGKKCPKSLNTLRPVMKSVFSNLHERNEVLRASSQHWYQALVAKYWPRQLSMEEDGINAFAAILEHLKDQWNAELHKSTMTFTAGMPHLIRQHAESPVPSLELFVRELAWYSNHLSRRRKGFPSWCWAGWTSPGMQAQLRWPCDSMSLLLVRNIFFRSSPDIDTSGVPWHQTATSERVPIAEHDFPNVPEAVIFDAPVVYPSVVSWPAGKDQPLLWGDLVSWHLGDMSLLKRDEFMDHIVNGEYCLLALRHREAKRKKGASSWATFLVVRQVDQYRHERIGLAELVEIAGTNAQLNRDSEIRSWELI